MNEAQVTCPFCRNIFDQQKIRDHLASEMGYKPFKCFTCHHCFRSRHSMDIHHFIFGGSHSGVIDERNVYAEQYFDWVMTNKRLQASNDGGQHIAQVSPSSTEQRNEHFGHLLNQANHNNISQQLNGPAPAPAYNQQKEVFPCKDISSCSAALTRNSSYTQLPSGSVDTIMGPLTHNADYADPGSTTEKLDRVSEILWNMEKREPSLSSMKHHSQSKTVVEYVCQLCGFRIIARDIFKLKKHAATHLQMKPYQCCHCSYSSHTKSWVKTHAQNMHKVQGDKEVSVVKMGMKSEEYHFLLQNKTRECFTK